MKNVLVIGGAGYVGSTLVPLLKREGYRVTVLDLFWYQYEDECEADEKIKGDIRDRFAVGYAMQGQDAVIHLACVSNDPSFELNPELGKSINYDSFQHVLHALEQSNVKRFIYASSSSVYGVKEEQNVTEDMTCEPLTDYSKYKLMCEKELTYANPRACWTIVRPSTVCGYSPRLRLDLVVNILTMSGLVNNRIMVNGGSQLRPNINIKDMALAYLALLKAPESAIRGETFNIGFENMSLIEIAKMVQKTLGGEERVPIEKVPSNDIRSYHVNSDKIARAIGFRAKFTINQAINSLVIAHAEKLIKDPFKNPLYHNIKRMQELSVT